MQCCGLVKAYLICKLLRLFTCRPEGQQSAATQCVLLSSIHPYYIHNTLQGQTAQDQNGVSQEMIHDSDKVKRPCSMNQ